MAWRRPGNKPWSEPMTVRLLMHISVTWPQWVKSSAAREKWISLKKSFLMFLIIYYIWINNGIIILYQYMLMTDFLFCTLTFLKLNVRNIGNNRVICFERLRLLYIYMLRWSWGRLSFIIRIPIMVRSHLYIESALWSYGGQCCLVDDKQIFEKRACYPGGHYKDYSTGALSLTPYVLNFAKRTKTYIYFLCHPSTLTWHS